MKKMTLVLLAISVSLGVQIFKQRYEISDLVSQIEKQSKELKKLKDINEQYLKQLNLCNEEREYHKQEADKHQAIVDQISKDYNTLKAEQATRVEIITKEIERVVEKPVYQNVCLDQEGIDLLNGINDMVNKQ